MAPEEIHTRLVNNLRRHHALTIAVSGGVDSLTLAYVAQRSGNAVSMIHAISPAVPALATKRVKAYAAREGWDLRLVDAGEFADPAYRANPLDRCYFCKSHLYDCARALSRGVVASGTNKDDLGDFRPGLRAAAERQIVHPFVECGIDKAGIRALARWQGLADIAELPAQPCLASRVETGLAIDAADLGFIDAMEQRVRAQLDERATVRCRITRAGVVIEIADTDAPDPERIARAAEVFYRERQRIFAGVRPYRQGAAFIKIHAGHPAKEVV